MRERKKPVRQHLDEKDVETLRALGENGRLRATADELGIAHQTLKNRLAEIYQILDVPGAAAAIYAYYVEGRTGPA